MKKKKKVVRNKKGKWGKGNLIINIRSDIDIFKHYGEGEKEVQEKIICKQFGCGKSLSPQEQLFGDRCQEHQKKETTMSIIDKHLSL